MTHPIARRLRALSLALVALACVASCAPNRLLQQHANPEYVGKPFKRVLVVAVTHENVLGRVFEDRMVALLGQRGIQGVPAYATLGTSGAADEATLRKVIAETRVDGMLIARTTSVDVTTVTSPGYPSPSATGGAAITATTPACGRRPTSHRADGQRPDAHRLRDAALRRADRCARMERHDRHDRPRRRIRRRGLRPAVRRDRVRRDGAGRDHLSGGRESPRTAPRSDVRAAPIEGRSNEDIRRRTRRRRGLQRLDLHLAPLDGAAGRSLPSLPNCSANGPCANLPFWMSTVCTPFNTTISCAPLAVIS